jgi:hypothetical protein
MHEMISTIQDRRCHGDMAVVFAGMSHSAIMVSPNIRLCMTTATGSLRSDFATRREITQTQAEERADAPDLETPADLVPPV